MKKILALVMVLAMVLALAACGSAKPAEPSAPELPADDPTVKSEGVMTYAEYAAADLDSQVTVETYVQAKQSWWDNKATLYTQDADGGYFLYNAACSEEDYNKLVEGSKIKVTGYKSEWAGEVEIIDATFEIEEGGYLADVKDVTALLGSDDLIAFQNEKVAFKGLTVEAAGDNGVWCHPRVRPDYLEAEAVGRLMRIAQAADVPVIVVHTTNAQALAEIRAARRRGQKVYVETCPQYLCLDDSVYDQDDWLESAKYVCSPPIRKKADQNALWRALRTGEVQTISTDHCSFNFRGQKELGRGNFTRIPNGLPGVEFRPAVIWSRGVTPGRITAPDMCRLMCETPAKAFGLWGRKGALTEGFDADIVVWDPRYRGVLDPRAQETACDYSPWEGMELTGRARAVYLVACGIPLKLKG